MLRTRQIVPSFLYPRLVEDGVVPSLFEHDLKALPDAAKRYPPIIYRKKCFAEFGLFMEHVIRKRLQRKFTEYSADVLMEVAHEVGWLDVTSDELQHILSFVKSKTESMIKLLPRKEFQFDVELLYEIISGHPDLLLEGETVYDVKNVSKFQTTKQSKDVRRDETKNNACLQVLTYFALLRALGRSVKSVALVLPMQGVVLQQNLEAWDSSDYLIRLLFTTQTLIESTSFNADSYLIEWMQIPHHLSIAGGLPQTVENAVRNNLPCFQVYLRPHTGPYRKLKYTDAQVDQIHTLLTESSCRMYVHGALDPNLAVASTDTETFMEDLDFCHDMGGCGVVVHVGKSKQEDVTDALKVMKKKIRNIIKNSATKRAPLILETPAGQGTELLSCLQDFINFYLSFTTAERQKFKVCIDTCHVFSAGYDPYYYLTQFTQACGVQAVTLIHFNNSAVPLGQCNDLHANPIGYIPLLTLNRVLEFAKANHISCVVE